MARKKLYQPHYSTTTDLRVVQSRQALCRALLELLDSKPLEVITIREIAARADVGYNTFFRHYKDKEALLREIATDEIERLLDLSMTTLDASNSLEASRALCHYVAEHETLWSTLLTGGAANFLREEFIRLTRKKAPSRISSSATLPADIGIKLVAVGTLELLAWWLEQAERMPVDELAAIYERLIAAPMVEAYTR
jgi:AcrR family transcriptional regulator